MAVVSNVITILTAQNDGKDADTDCFLWTNLADGQQFSSATVPYGDIPAYGSRPVEMKLDHFPTEEQVIAGFQLRVKWDPKGNDEFDGDGAVQILFSDGITRRWDTSIKMRQGIEWYVFPLAGVGTIIS